ncbi:hypothetical protein GF415_04300 [Candidatus Micrarchaeota archaeon]|nr:hypothetical protein [Candidatus Micrarchaeota archaeon]
MRLYFKLLLMFILTQVMGIYAGSYIIEDAKTNQYVDTLMMVETGPSSLVYFVFAVICGALLFILLHRLHISLLFTLLELAVISTTSSIFFYSLINPVLLSTLDSMVFAILGGMMFSVIKQLFPSLKNLAAMVSSAGAGAVFGFTFGFITSLVFLFILAIYDYISVFKTKHMITMANEIVERDMAFTISAEKIVEKGKKARLDLGTGDLSLPIMVGVAAYSISPLLSLFTLTGSTLGTLFVLFIAWKHHTVLPALPPITAGIFIFSIAAIYLGVV